MKIQIPSEMTDVAEGAEDYWAEELGVSPDGLALAIGCIGRSVSKLRKHLNDGFRVAIRDESGVARKVARITLLNDGFAVLVPYHTTTKGHILSLGPLDYGKSGKFLLPVPLSGMKSYTVSGPVKLSFHLTGFVQFSTSSGHKVVSGYCDALKKPKGAGLRAPDDIEVSSGPLFSVKAFGLDQYKALKAGEDAVLLERDDIWHHPGYEAGDDTSAYHFEFWQLHRRVLSEALGMPTERVLRTELPFNSRFDFRHDLKLMELPGSPWCLGVHVCRAPSGSNHESGYMLSGPGCRSEEDNEFYNLQAMYPPTEMADHCGSVSLDYKDNDQQPQAG